MSGSATASMSPARWLWALLVLFSVRVLAQLVQHLHPVSWLPAFERWQGSALPYPVLLASQLAIVCCAAVIARRVGRGGARSRRLGGVLLVLGSAYFAVMGARLGLSQSLLDGHPWFGKPLPAFFHLVLAGYILVLGRYHWRTDRGGA